MAADRAESDPRGPFEVWRERTSREDGFADPRPVADGGVVTLREVTRETVRAVVRLSVGADQARRVAPNAVSIAEAHFAPHAWFRAVYADETPVGFAQLVREPGADHADLWRFMIDARYQGRGYGRAALERIVEEIRRDPGVRELRTSWVPEPGGPEPFYLGFGFEPTGEIDEGEVVGRLTL